MKHQRPLIYIVEDHKVIRDGVRQYLELSGYSVREFGDLASTERALRGETPDLLIQDVMLPDGDGFMFVKELKETVDLPVIFMTARIDESDRILGFELGADDYVTKPFSPKELVMRVQAVLRRTATSKSSITYYIGEELLSFDEGIHQAHINGELMQLTAAEWRVLAYLIRQENQLCTRAEILEHCFDYNFESYERVVDTHIKNIRAKLGEGEWIETIRGYGYRFLGLPQKDTIE